MMITSLKHSDLSLCTMVSTPWQADYRSTPRAENSGFIGNNLGSCDEGWDG